MGAGDVVQLVKGLTTVHKAMGPIPSTHKWHGGALTIPEFGKWGLENQKFKVILSVIASSSPSWPL